MRISFYGRLAETVGREIQVEVNGACTVADLRERIAELYPHAANDIAGPRSRACVADRIVADGFIVQPGDDVEILAPLSGG